MRIILAPMEGVVTHVMRDLLTQLGGIDRCVTEFVRVNNEVYPARVFYRYCPELKSGGMTPAGTPVYLQLLGGRPEPMAQNAVRAVELGAPGIDINFGCPAKTVNRSDGGAIILRSPERVHNITAAVRQAVPDNIPVTVKMRLGFEDASLLHENANAIISAGANELIIHARTKVDGYHPPAHWHHVRPVKDNSPIPVIANGEIWTVEDHYECIRQSACEDIMIGRGILSRPDLPTRIKQARQGIAQSYLPWDKMLTLLVELLNRIEPNSSKKHVGGPVKQWLAYLRRGYREAELVLEKIKYLKGAEQIRSTLLQCQKLPNHGLPLV